MKTLATTLIILILSSNFSLAQNNLGKNEMQLTVTKESDATLIQWNTAIEVNSSYFIIERSSDGEKYEVLGTLKASSSTYKSTNYEFEDYTDSTDAEAYRVTLVLMDGQTVSTTFKESLPLNLAKAVGK